jgi:radical SAM superfamily enzyme YgiQ (UPF0313 family)
MADNFKILLIQLCSPQEDWSFQTIPLGLMYIGAVLKASYADRIETRLFDMGIGRFRGNPREHLESYLQDFAPDLTAIRGLTCQQDEFARIAALVKSKKPESLVFAGGPHANAEPEDLLKVEAIDFLVLGEGEETMKAMVGRLLEGRDILDAKGIAYRKDGGIHMAESRDRIQSLDSIPFPDYSLIDLDDYQAMTTMTSFFAKERYSTLFTSRGCPYRCIYCHNIFGKKIRFRSAQNIFDEMVYLHKTHNVSEFHIIEDCFNFNRARMLETFKLIARSGYKFWIAFPNGLRGDLMDEEMVKWAKAAGTHHVAYAVESATPRIQKMIKKHVKLEKLRQVIEWTAREGIFTSTFNMLGFPTETEEEMRETIRFALESPVHMAIFFLVTPYQNTELFNLALEHGYTEIKEGKDLRYQNIGDDSAAWFTLVTRKKIKEMLYDFNFRFYFDVERIRRVIDLIPWSHNWDQIGQFYYNRMKELGISIEAIPDKQVQRLLWKIIGKAKEVDPEACAVLPAAPSASILGRLKQILSGR